MSREWIRFYTDEHVSIAVVSGLRRRGADVLTTPEAGLLGADDRAHLAFAHRLGRVLFTQDSDFLTLSAQGARHSSIVYAHRQTPTGRIVAGLTLMFEVMEPVDMADHVEFI